MENETIQILELFGGIGSPRCALRNLNIPTKAIDYVEINEKAVRSYNSMFREELAYKTQTVVGWNLKPDILIHGSPCQDMSIAGHQGKATGEGRINRGKGSDEGSGTRSSLMWETIHIIENMGEWRPRYVIWENVKNVKSKYMRPNFDRYMVEMERLGYTNNFEVLDAREFGLPQARERVFTVSVLNGEKFEFDDLIRTPMRTLQEFLEDDASVPDVYDVTQPSVLACIGEKGMQSNCVQIVVDDAGIFAGVGRLWYVYTDPTSGRQYVFSTDEVMHFKTSFSFDGITGLPVQQILRDTVAGASESQAFMNNLYESGLTAKATLEYTGELNEKAKTALVKSFEEFGSGAKNTGKILPVPLGMKLTPLDIKLTDSQFFELKKYNALQIAGAFGVKPNQINDYSKSSYSNSEMQQLSFYVDTELFIIKQYEEEINFKILPDEDADDGYYYKFNEKVLFRTDSKTQMEYLRNGVGGMIIKPNEARRKLDMEDAEGGDVLLANGSIVPLTMAGAAYLKGASEPDETEEPEQPEEKTEPDAEQPDTATEPDETDEAEDEDEQEGGE